MAYQATVTVSWVTTGQGPNGDNIGAAPSSVVITNADSPAAPFEYQVVSGSNNWPVPLTFGSNRARMLVILPPSGNTVALTWNSSGATGGVLDIAQASLISLPVGATNVYIGANGSVTLRGVWL